MRKKNYKGRCEKKTIDKCKTVCKTYDPIQSAYVDILDDRNDVAEIKCNVELDGDAADFTTDISESVIFGKDYHTGYFVQAEKGHHCMLIGSTGSGKSATSLISSILSCTSGSKQVIDIKSVSLRLRPLIFMTKRL